MLKYLKKISYWVRQSWSMLGSCIVTFLILEVFLTAGYLYKDITDAYDNAFWGDETADIYSGADWAEEFYEEEKVAKTKEQWKAYVHWRGDEYQGKYINVDANGIRKTWHRKQAPEAGKTPLKVFMFGGSTMWGTGERDEFTIPSLFSKTMDENNIDVQVTNYGQLAYTNTQEMITLVTELQNGNIPDKVIFYDGVNEVLSAYLNNKAGVTTNDTPLRNVYGISKLSSSSLLLKIANDKFSTIRFSKDIGDMLFAPPKEDQPYLREILTRYNFTLFEKGNEERLSDDIISIYLNNLKLINNLAKEYAFDVVFYWQPTIFDKPYLTEYEDSKKFHYLDMEPLFEAVYKKMKKNRYDERENTLFYNISSVFSDVKKPVFLDWCHMGEVGNRIVAQKMADDMISKISADMAYHN